MTATASLERRAKSPLNLVYITTHTCEEINIPLSHMRGELCVPSCVEGNVVWKAATFSILLRAQRPVMFIHPPPHTTSLFSLPTFFSRISSALSTPTDILSFSRLARARSGVGGIVGWRRKTSPSGEGERKPICGQVWISFPFYGKSSTMGGMIPKLLFSLEGGQTPRENQFSFSNAETTELMDISFAF